MRKNLLLLVLAAAQLGAQAAPPASEPDDTEAMRKRSKWLLAQPREIYTIGADDTENEVEITHVYRGFGYNQALYVAVQLTETDSMVAMLNDMPALYSHRRGHNSYVFVFSCDDDGGKQDDVALRFTFMVRFQLYEVKTTLKALLAKEVLSREQRQRKW
jgi:hypothetical protein